MTLSKILRASTEKCIRVPMAPWWHVYQRIFGTLQHVLVSLGGTEAAVVAGLTELE